MTNPELTPPSLLGAGAAAVRRGEQHLRALGYFEQRIRQSFLAILSSEDRDLWPQDFVWGYDIARDKHVLRTRFQEANIAPRYIEIGRDELYGIDPSFDLPAVFDPRHLQRLWSLAHEDWRLERQITSARERYLRASSDEPYQHQRDLWFEQEVAQIRAAHLGQLGYNQHQAALAQYAGGNLGAANAQHAQVAMYQQAAQQNLAHNAFFADFYAGLGGYDSEAAKRGEDLLRANLTPVQLAQYDKDRSFTCVGSRSGKTYRINYGTSMNIEELSDSGEKVCVWCFLPEGGLCPGDVMLGQKIALEGDERKALKVANRFGLAGTQRQGQGMVAAWIEDVSYLVDEIWNGV